MKVRTITLWSLMGGLGALVGATGCNLITGAEDFSFFQEHVPGLFLMLGVNEPGVAAGEAASNHSPFFNASEAALMTGVRALVGFAMDYAEATADD